MGQEAVGQVQAREGVGDPVPAAHGEAAQRPARAQGALRGARRPLRLQERRRRHQEARAGGAGNQYTPQDHTHRDEGVRRREGGGVQDGAAQVGEVRARALQLHVARRLQAARRREVAHRVPGRRLTAHNGLRRVCQGHGGARRGGAEKGRIRTRETRLRAYRPRITVLRQQGGIRRGEARFESELVVRGIRHILACVNHPHTNGKLERFYGKVQRKLPLFVASSVGNAFRAPKGSPATRVGCPFCMDRPRDPVEQLVEWHNNKPHM